MSAISHVTSTSMMNWSYKSFRLCKELRVKANMQQVAKLMSSPQCQCLTNAPIQCQTKSLLVLWTDALMKCKLKVLFRFSSKDLVVLFIIRKVTMSTVSSMWWPSWPRFMSCFLYSQYNNDALLPDLMDVVHCGKKKRVFVPNNSSCLSASLCMNSV